MVSGLKRPGLDPAQVKYVVISHAHGGHDEGARLFQERSGAHVVMGGPDWDALDKSAGIVRCYFTLMEECALVNKARLAP